MRSDQELASAASATLYREMVAERDSLKRLLDRILTEADKHDDIARRLGSGKLRGDILRAIGHL